MATTLRETRWANQIRKTLATAGIAALVSTALHRAVGADSYNFNSGNDNGWQRYSLPAMWAATFAFPDDGMGGKAYRIYAPPTGDDPFGLGNARAGSFLPTVYTGRFYMGADFLAWNANWEQEAGLLFYLQDVGLGTSDGYAATYSSGYKRLYISAVNDERPTTVAEVGNGNLVLDPSRRYRLVASSHDGYTLVFQLFDLAEPDSPVMSAVGMDGSYYSGYCGFLVFEQRYPSATDGAEATFDNYIAKVPADGEMPAIVTDLLPPPAGKAREFYPRISVSILDRDTTVDPASIKFFLDGQLIPNSSLTIEPAVVKASNPANMARDFSGATASYDITTLLPWGSKHTNAVVFTDNTGKSYTNTWTWTSEYPLLPATKSLPIGSLGVRGFDFRTVQSDNGGVNLANSLARARLQLAVPPQVPIDRSATGIVQVLDWDKKNEPPNNVPGLCAGSYINIAVECSAYLELKAGTYRFHIISDDRSGLYSGLADTADMLVLWENPDSTANATFEFAVEADGLYPVHLIWEETGGAAKLQLFSVNPGDQSEILVNDPSNPPGVIKAWYPLVCYSAESITGPWTVERTASNAINTVNIAGSDCASAVVGSMVTGGRFTTPVSTATRFYRIEAPRKVRITKFEKGSTTVQIDYVLE